MIRSKPHRRIYFDHNATTPIRTEVASVVRRTLRTFGNASSPHREGKAARKILNSARAALASLINCDPDEIVFTGGGTEANNLVLTMALDMASPSRDEIAISAIEHPSIFGCRESKSFSNVPVKVVPVTADGKLSMTSLATLVSSRTMLVSVMAANNEIGTIQDVAEVARIAHEQGVLVHTDAVQALGRIPVDVRKWDVDYLSVSAHKINALKGVGALYVKKGVPFQKLHIGGRQELDRRPGTENTLGIASFGAAITVVKECGSDEMAALRVLREQLKKGILEIAPDAIINGHTTDVLPNTLSISFPETDGERLLLLLDRAGIALSTGSACMAGQHHESHVIRAIGLEERFWDGTIRISLGYGNTHGDVECFLERFERILR